MATSERYSDRNVYILGAGFSAEGGLPVMRNFTNKMRDAHPWLRSNGYVREANAIDKLFEFRLEATSAAERVLLDLENIEELFSLAAATAGESLTQDVTLAIAGTLLYSAQTAPRQNYGVLASKSWTPPRHWEREGGEFHSGSGPAYRYICSRFEYFTVVLAGLPGYRDADRRDAFITFNYDTLVEDALHSLSIPFSYGFAAGTVDLDYSARCARSPGPADDVPMLKLHGSVNWAMKGNRLTVYGTYDDERAQSLNPLLVPPTWRKESSGEMLTVWEAAVKALRTATRVIIMGYSMPRTDQHFKYLLAAGLQQNISLREIWFVNRSAISLQDSLFEVLRKDLRPHIVKLSDVSIGVTDFLATPQSIGRSVPSL